MVLRIIKLILAAAGHLGSVSGAIIREITNMPAIYRALYVAFPQVFP